MDKSPDNLFRVVDAHMEKDFSLRSLSKVVQLALMCVEDNPNARPNLSELAEILNTFTVWVRVDGNMPTSPLLNMPQVGETSSSAAKATFERGESSTSGAQATFERGESSSSTAQATFERGEASTSAAQATSERGEATTSTARSTSERVGGRLSTQTRPPTAG